MLPARSSGSRGDAQETASNDPITDSERGRTNLFNGVFCSRGGLELGHAHGPEGIFDMA